MEGYAMGDTNDNQHEDQILLRALATRDRLRRELQDVEIFLTLYPRFSGIKSADRQQDQEDYANESVSAENSAENLKEEVATNPGMRQTELIPFVRKILLENGRPILPYDLVGAIKERGRHIGGSDEMNNLKSKLWRAKKEIIMISGAGYWPIDVACPTVSYEAPETLVRNKTSKGDSTILAD